MIEFSNSNNYPFPTQKHIVAALATNEAFRHTCLRHLVARQTEDERESKSTKYSNKRGLRCSESVWMVELDAKLRNEPDAVTDEEQARLQRTLPVYRKQLAAFVREQMMEADPSLRERAKVFGL